MEVKSLKNNTGARRYPNGHVVVREGDTTGSEMYIILEGQVDVYKNYQEPDEKKLATLEAGSFFGEMTLFLNKKRTETMVTQEEQVVLLAVQRENANDFCINHPQLAYSLMKTLCQRLDDANKVLRRENIPNAFAGETPAEPLFAAEAATPIAPVAQESLAPHMLLSDTSPASNANGFPPGFFPEGHKSYTLEFTNYPGDLIYKKKFTCPICEEVFLAYSVRSTRLKLINRDKDFRKHYQSIDTTYYEIITCPQCLFSNFETAYTQPVISRLKENIRQITAYKHLLNLDFTEDRSINTVFAGYFLALKNAPLFYKSCEMFVAKIWLRLMWLYHDCKDFSMEAMAAKKAHKAYLSAFEKTDASPAVIQKLCVLIGEISLIVKAMPNAKLFFVKARGYRTESKAMLIQAEDGIETIRRIEAGQIKL